MYELLDFAPCLALMGGTKWRLREGGGGWGASGRGAGQRMEESGGGGWEMREGGEGRRVGMGDCGWR